MAALKTYAEHASFGGVQGFHRHASDVIGLPMRFGVYLPPQAEHGPVPVLVWLAGLTCTEETFAIKAGAQRVAAELGLMLVTPDTSPRGTGIEGADASWDFGHGAGFYLDATREPWAAPLAHGKLPDAGAAGAAGRALRGARRRDVGCSVIRWAATAH